MTNIFLILRIDFLNNEFQILENPFLKIRNQISNIINMFLVISFLIDIKFHIDAHTLLYQYCTL